MRDVIYIYIYIIRIVIDVWNPRFHRQADALDKPSKDRSISRNVERFDWANNGRQSKSRVEKPD